MYILINNPKAPPQSVELKTSFTAPFRTVAAAEVCDTESMGFFKCSVFVHCPEKSLFFITGPWERGASQISQYQFISSEWSQFRDLLHCSLCGGADCRDQVNPSIRPINVSIAQETIPLYCHAPPKRFVRAKASHLDNTKMYLLKSENCCE